MGGPWRAREEEAAEVRDGPEQRGGGRRGGNSFSRVRACACAESALGPTCGRGFVRPLPTNVQVHAAASQS